MNRLAFEQELSKLTDEELLGKKSFSPLIKAVQSHHSEYPEEQDSLQAIVDNLLQLRKNFYLLKDDELDEALCRSWKFHLHQVATQFQRQMDVLNNMEQALSSELSKFQHQENIGKHCVSHLMDVPAELSDAMCLDAHFLERCIQAFSE